MVAALAVVALVPLAPPAPAHTPAVCTVSPSDQAIDAEEQALLGLINQYRQSQGLNRLFFQHDVVRAAAWLSRDMATNDSLSHTDSNGRWIDTRMAWCGVAFSDYAENIYAGQSTAQAAFDWWKNSPIHNGNMLRASVTAAGIARAYDASSTYGWYWTLDVTNTSVFNVAIGDVSIAEGNGGSRTAYFPVTLSNPSTGTVSVAYATSNSTATQPSDYTARSGTISFAPGVTSTMVGISVRADSTDEPNEAFRVNLSSPAGARITDGVGVGTIVDDDPSSGLRLSVGDAAIYEGDSGSRMVRLSVVLSQAGTSTVTVTYATANGTALQPVDYTAKTGTLTFNPGVTTQFVNVAVRSDVAPEANEAFLVKLSGATGGAVIADATGVASIRTDD